MQINTGRNGAVLASLQAQAAEGGVLRLYRGLLAACLRPQCLRLPHPAGQLRGVSGCLKGFKIMRCQASFYI